MISLFRPFLVATVLSLLAACSSQAPSHRADESIVPLWRQLEQAATRLVGQGELDLALAKARQALAQLNADSNARPANKATVLAKIGWIYRLMFKHQHSEAYYLQSLRIRERIVGKDHPDYADSLLGLGMAYGNQQRREEAIRVLDWALALADKHLGPAHPEIDNYLTALAVVQEDALDFNAAYKLRQRSLTLRTRLHGPAHRQVADARWRLALAARRTGRPTMATNLFSQSLASYQQFLGNSVELASRMHTVALNLRSRGQYARAAKLLKDALSMRLSLMPVDNPEVIGNLDALADTYRDMNQIDRSLQHRTYATKARNGINPFR